MFELKPIHANAIPAALEKAERYRLLNQPAEAESICRDILAIAPGNLEAQIALVLALTDQFPERVSSTMADALAQAERIQDAYERTYLTGLVYERWAKAQLARGTPAHSQFGWLRRALQCYQQAESMAPEGNDEAVLRWNACVRFVERHGLALGPDAPAPPRIVSHELPLE